MQKHIWGFFRTEEVKFDYVTFDFQHNSIWNISKRVDN